VTRRYGTRPDLPDHRDGWFDPGGSLTARLPKSVDLRPKCPPVFHQGALNSCTANALAAAIWFEAVRENPTTAAAPSRLFIYYNERSAERQPRCNVPVSQRDGYKAVARFGACAEKHWPYIVGNFSVRPPARCYPEGAVNRVAAYLRVPRGLRPLKACLAGGRPFTMGISVYASFESAAVRRSGIVPMPHRGETLKGGHAVLVVGYQDRTASFIVRNSWGVRWGMAGYFLLPYAFVMSDKQYAWDFWTITGLSSAHAKRKRGLPSVRRRGA
jgi:C1A family cysteine protease